MTPASAFAPETTIAVIGAGRLGGVLARSLRAAGFRVLGPLRRDDAMPSADIALLCVPDAAIPAVAFVARPHVRLVGHVSGATPLDDVDFSMHPLQTFTGSEMPDVFLGLDAAVAGRTPEALVTAEQLARALGAQPFLVDDAHRAGYHAAASFASNFVLTVLDAAEQLARTAGVDRHRLAPLVRQTVDNWVATGAPDALTGPVARGDARTIERQRDAVEASAPRLAPLFSELVAATRAVAERAGSTSAAGPTTPPTPIPEPEAASE